MGRSMSLPLNMGNLPVPPSGPPRARPARTAVFAVSVVLAASLAAFAADTHHRPGSDRNPTAEHVPASRNASP